MKLVSDRESLLIPIQNVIGAVEKRQTLPVLGNLLISAKDKEVSFTATDLEVELVSQAELAVDEPGDITVPARKLLDIVKALPVQASVSIETRDSRCFIRSGKSRFMLATLPADEFPTLEDIKTRQSWVLDENIIQTLLNRTSFSMAAQDVRYYLNGLLIELKDHELRTVATDGHRLATSKADIDFESSDAVQVILPRKGVNELARLLDGQNRDVTLELGQNHVRVTLPQLRFTSKLVDGRFPDYQRVLPKGESIILDLDKNSLKQCLQRASILSNEKYRGIRLSFSDGLMTIQANNPEQEEAEEQLEIDFHGERVEIGFNVTYLLDVLNHLTTEIVEMHLKDADSSTLMKDKGQDESVYVVMPMRL